MRPKYLVKQTAVTKDIVSTHWYGVYSECIWSLFGVHSACITSSNSTVSADKVVTCVRP